ncbi:hypothetical protein NDU88_000243 [Pleurodeles waltl]|uniref:KRAB domain-containing protein n=1 Tax=Pleurodeles waltl TaxID=8319 RepID=A0AAV7P1Y5_PLEWA|nr:hypothetical protein NDU88_000243 [Pleurodeles waltl]
MESGASSSAHAQQSSTAPGDISEGELHMCLEVPPRLLPATACARSTREPGGGEMPRQPSAEVSFQEASVCFSEEEWGLLREWQKELYMTVMKEIHQALISLGPLIVTTVSSLRAKEKEEHLSRAEQGWEQKHRIHPSPSDSREDPEMCFKVNFDESPQWNNPQDPEGKEVHERLSTEHPFVNTEISLRKEEPVSISIDHRGDATAEGTTGPNSVTGFEVLSFHIKDEAEACAMVHRDRMRLGSPSGE